MEASVQPDLIYDVGMHNGDDTAHYLEQGFRVIGIEADPDFADACRKRFAAHVGSGQLTILNVGVAQENGSAKFWICDSNSVWNSFDRSMASRAGCPHHSIEIQTRCFDDILRSFGIPVYLKIDIEGNDRLCLDALRGTRLPDFISAEDQGIDESLGVPVVPNLMRELGYRYFKLVSQHNFEPYFRRKSAFVDRVTHSAAHGRFQMPGLRSVAEYCTFKSILARRNGGYQFPYGSSGPWGEGIPGRWFSFETISRAYNLERARHFSQPGVTDYSFWCDWHAKVMP
jgi:FkbM family methyltransferase